MFFCDGGTIAMSFMHTTYYGNNGLIIDQRYDYG